MSEVGTIGQIYEDRRTKKRGKLLERDEKYKTLLMESDDGKSFNITYGGFKSNWRKIDEEVPTIEQAMEEVKIPEEVSDRISVEPKKKRKKYKKKPLPESGVCVGLENAVEMLAGYIDSFNSNKISINPAFSRDLIGMKIGFHKFIEIFHKPTTKHYTIACKEDVAKVADKLQYIDEVKYYATRKPLNFAFKVSDNNFNKLLNDLRPVVLDVLKEEDK